MASSNPNSNSNTNAANQSSLLRPPPPSFPSSALFSAAAQHQTPPPHPLRSPFQLPPTSINPSPAAPKRPPPHKPPPPPSSSAAAASAAAAAKSAELTPAARRKKRKLPDKHLPDRVAALLPESALYTQLLEFESRVDSALARKRLDIQDSLKSPPSLHRTLRLFVFNTADAASSSWTLRLLGRLLDDLGDPVPNPPKLSSFFKRLTVSLDPALYPDNPTIVWDQARSPAPHDGFEIKRRGGDRDFTAAIRLELNYSPERFKLSPALADLLGIEVDTRARVLAGVWHYVKARKLQHPADPASFLCDPPLRKVFGEDRIRFALVSQKISQHLSPPQPIQIEHRVRVSSGGTGGNAPLGTACYDVQVDVPFPLQKEMAAFLANTEKQKEIDACDEVICASIKKIHEHRRRRAFFLGFSQSPVEFINALIASQSRDLKLVAGEASRNAEKERRSDFYNQPWVEDAVIRYLNRKPAAGSEAPGST